MKKLLRVEIEYKIDGMNGLNFDQNVNKPMPGSDKTYALKQLKSNIYGNNERVVKISGNCLRNALFKNDEPYLIRKIAIEKAEELTLLRLSSVGGYIRGYQNMESGNNYKRFSSIVVPDAEAERGNNAAKIVEEFFSSSSTEKDNNSIFNQEQVGNVIYRGKMAIDINTLQLLPLDNATGRNSFPTEVQGNALLQEEIRKAISKLVGGDVSEIGDFGYHRFNTQILPEGYGEYGFLLSDKAVSEIVIKFLLNYFVSLKIVRGARAKGELRDAIVKLVLSDANQSSDSEFTFPVQELYPIVTESEIAADEFKKMAQALRSSVVGCYISETECQPITALLSQGDAAKSANKEMIKAQKKELKLNSEVEAAKNALNEAESNHAREQTKESLKKQEQEKKKLEKKEQSLAEAQKDLQRAQEDYNNMVVEGA